MSCRCSQHIDSPGDYRTAPDAPCAMCAEKHAATAYALACEVGYSGIDRARIIGELVLSAWHIWQTDRRTAELLRDIRHAIQQRRESEVTQAQWQEIFDRLQKFALDASPPPL